MAVAQDIIDLIRSVLLQKTSSMDFWSDYDDTMALTSSAPDVTHSKTITVPAFGVGSIPVGATVVCVHVLVKIRAIFDTSSAENYVAAAFKVQLSNDGGVGWEDAVDIAADSWNVAADEVGGGDVIEGIIDLSQNEWNGADTYSMRMENADSFGDNLELIDVQWALRVTWY